MSSNQKKEDILSVCMLASGSRGNACYVSNGESSILIDAGLSGKEIQRRMQLRGLDAENLTAIAVTHEHIDHVRGAGVLARRFDLPLFINKGTYAAVSEKIGKVDDLRFFECGTGFAIGGLKVHPFSISHDAQDPAGFTVSHKDKSMGIATDLGVSTAVVRERLKGCNVMILEANHDPRMLENGPYPWPLKQRVKSRIGHLSNEESRDLLMDVRTDKLCHVILGHISMDNNTPEKALGVVGEGLNGSGVSLVAASQDHPCDLIKI